MTTAKVFKNGQSQAVRIPKEFRFTDDEVGIVQMGIGLFLFPKNSSWETFLNAEPVSEDFAETVMAARKEDVNLGREIAL